ncbi:peroxidase family protein [Acanthopleuribacter pedis]|uniref:Peroxidase family protein n=1 Tax=Acanthopleuribacter pedis TaxID=442870 RepID=A0A8J7U367_9BACT|nr:peroxidase family protein [Acanthopleuribacter pedis]MBO1318464.1 peroxidase family protein [Acanthopleuribacter pedis]
MFLLPSSPTSRLSTSLFFIFFAATFAVAQTEYRTIDGSNNNRNNPTWGTPFTQLERVVPPAYADGVSTLSGQNRPAPRDISNIVLSQSESKPSSKQLTDMVWVWGQFLDHDISLTNPVFPLEPHNISLPEDDPFFISGVPILPFNRSEYDRATGTGPDNPRQQLNEITAFIDASNVYGSDQERATALRANDGSGRLKVGPANLLPFLEGHFDSAGGGTFLPFEFFAGDERVNENVALISMHTLWMREHNRLADEIRGANPNLSGEEIYQRARALVGAQMQVITYREWLPMIMGPIELDKYKGYKRDVNPQIMNLFSSAAFRFGHSMLSATVPRIEEDGSQTEFGHLALRSAFFNPAAVLEQGGIEPILRGLSNRVAEEVDGFIVDEVRNFLFGIPGAGGLDLGSINIQRGRDHGLADYNTIRQSLGFLPVTSFQEISSDPEVSGRLEQVYGDVNRVDFWVGAMSEDKIYNAAVGLTLAKVFKLQFERLRDGDRFWYETQFRGQTLRWLKDQTLAKVIERNSTVTNKMLGKNVFTMTDRYAADLKPDTTPDRPFVEGAN